MNVLSLFDGMSCGQLALERAGIKVNNYFASEVDKYAIKIAMKNYPNTIQLGDVRNVHAKDLPRIDLILAGSPCQGFSVAGKGLAFDDPRSALFFEFVRLVNEFPEAHFLLENVRMTKLHRDMITFFLKVAPVAINSSLVSAQNRQRLYWGNFDFPIPDDLGITLDTILQDLPDCPIGVRVREKSQCLRVGGRNSLMGSRLDWDNPFQRITKKAEVKKSILKAGCLTGGANSGGNHSDMDIIHTPLVTRRYSPIECERLQTLPDGYTAGVSNTQRYKMLGNGWTADVVAHILRHLPT